MRYSGVYGVLVVHKRGAVRSRTVEQTKPLIKYSEDRFFVSFRDLKVQDL